jgi:uncharacterized protein YehS (DUF1456 family)
MNNNQLLRVLRDVLAASHEDMAEIFRLAGHTAEAATTGGFLADTDAAGFVACSDLQLRYFLEGLILSERGPRDGAALKVEEGALSNNQILKKLRIAFNLQELDMLAIFEEGGDSLSSSELGSLFRKEENKHFRQCSDALLESFLRGLTPSLDSTPSS